MSENTSVHRLLDEAFAGVVMTPEAQDLKEEIRANLLDRVAELQAGGVQPAEAARSAVAELGDVRNLLDGLPDGGTGSGREGAADFGTPPSGRAADRAERTAARSAARSATAEALRHRVRPQPGFVAGVVLVSIVLAAAVVGTALTAVLGPDDALVVPSPLAVVAGAALAWVVASSLAQETTTSYPMPAGRARLFGLGWGLVLLGPLLAMVHVVGAAPYGWYVLDGLALVGGVTLLSYLGATRTNRRKPWALELEERHHGAGNRFEEDPAAAARFGIYTAVLWSLTGVGIYVVGSTVGWMWCFIPAVAGWAVFMLMLATMLFGHKNQEPEDAAR